MLAERHGAGVLVRTRSAEAVAAAVAEVFAPASPARGAAAAVGARMRLERGAADAAAVISRCDCAGLAGRGLDPGAIAAIRRNCVVCWGAAGVVPRYDRAVSVAPAGAAAAITVSSPAAAAVRHVNM
jgi:hypothetical protein